MENILTTFETAKILNTSPENVRAMEKRGVLHAKRIGTGTACAYSTVAKLKSWHVNALVVSSSMSAGKRCSRHVA